MRTLGISLLATTALVGGITIASAQSSNPTAPSGPMAGGASPPNVAPGVSGTRSASTRQRPPSPAQGSANPTAPSGPMAGGASPPR
jgi:hypothetical protein